MSRSKARGTAWETAIVRWLAAHGWPHAERRQLHGQHDRGDIAGIIGVVIEAKDCGAMKLAEWLTEAEVERGNDGATVGVVWHKRRGKASPGEAYVTMTGETFAHLLRESGY